MASMSGADAVERRLLALVRYGSASALEAVLEELGRLSGYRLPQLGALAAVAVYSQLARRQTPSSALVALAELGRNTTSQRLMQSALGSGLMRSLAARRIEAQPNGRQVTVETVEREINRMVREALMFMQRPNIGRSIVWPGTVVRIRGALMPLSDTLNPMSVPRTTRVAAPVPRRPASPRAVSQFPFPVQTHAYYVTGSGADRRSYEVISYDDGVTTIGVWDPSRNTYVRTGAVPPGAREVSAQDAAYVNTWASRLRARRERAAHNAEQRNRARHMAGRVRAQQRARQGRRAPVNRTAPARERFGLSARDPRLQGLGRRAGAFIRQQLTMRRGRGSEH